MRTRFVVSELDIDPMGGIVAEQGWQSWSPSATYPVGTVPFRWADERMRLLCYRPEVVEAGSVYRGEGLLAARPVPDGPVHVWSAADGVIDVPTIELEIAGTQARVSADGPVDHHVDDAGGGVDGALARWADRFADRVGVGSIRRAPTVWCSWYHYFTGVTEADIDENLAAIVSEDLPIDVIQLDDGYQTAHGDWLKPSDRFDNLPAMVERIRSAGKRAGIWLAPHLVFPESDLATEHPDWLVRTDEGAPALGGSNWGRDCLVLDTTNPAALDHLLSIFRTMAGWGIDYFKIDFIYAGAIPGRRHLDLPPLEAYRRSLMAIRSAIGDAYLLGCGAPMLPSVGLVDAMRVSPDTGPGYEPWSGDYSQPASRAAMITGRGRAFMHGRFWVNDPDCLIVRPEVERREEWADHVAAWGGLRASSDRIASLDEWGLAKTRELLSCSPVEPFIAS
jgi:alpha-galactosidase